MSAVANSAARVTREDFNVVIESVFFPIWIKLQSSIKMALRTNLL